MKYSFYLAYPKAEISPVMLVIRHRFDKVAISLGISVNPNAWDKELSRVTTKVNDAKFINLKIAESEKAIKKAFTYGEFENLSIDEVANIYRKEMGLEQKEIKHRAELFIPFFEMWATTSFGKHNATRQTLYQFNVFREFVGKKIQPTFDDINYNMYIKYVTYLQKKGYKPNMIGTFIKALKAAMSEGYKRGMHTNIAFQNFEKPSEQATTVALTKEEVDKIYAVKLTGAVEKARDLFIIGCYTGMRFSDYNHLLAEDADKDFIVKIQQKTKNEVCIPIHPRVKAILKKWGGSPRIGQQKVNLFIKSVCCQVGINSLVDVKENGVIVQKQKHELVSTHTARRTAATNLLLSGATIHEVQKFLGHNSVKQTEIYLRISAQETARRIAENKFFSEE